METLENLKNNYAQEQGYDDWDDMAGQSSEYIDKYWTEVCIRAQGAALEKAADSGNKFFRTAEMRDLETQLSKEEISYSRMIEIINEKADVFYRTSITNPENLIL